jgi:ABC-2 type transport system permease protein
LGSLFQLSDWANWIAPHGHIPRLPVEEMAWMPLPIMMIIAAAITIIAFIGYKKRDMMA